MGAGFAFVDLALAQKPGDVGVVLGELFDSGFARRQIINAAIADVPEINLAWRDPTEAQGRLHSGAFLVAAAQKGEGAVDLIEKLLQKVGKPGFQPGGGLLEGSWQQSGDFLRCDATGILPRLGSPHAVADGKNEIHAFTRRVPEFSEMMDFPPIKAEAQKSVLVVGADRAA